MMAPTEEHAQSEMPGLVFGEPLEMLNVFVTPCDLLVGHDVLEPHERISLDHIRRVDQLVDVEVTDCPLGTDGDRTSKRVATVTPCSGRSTS